MLKRFCLLLMLIMFLIINSYGQVTENKDDVEDETNTISIDTKAVSFELRVRTSKGELLSKLNPKDFLVYEDGQEQEIAHFSRVETPINLVMVIDTSSSVNQHKDIIKLAVHDFIYKLNAYDRVAILQFKDRPILLSDFSSNREKMLFGLINLGDRVIETTEGDTYFSSEGSNVYDSVALAIKLLEKTEGRKAILVFSDWMDTGSLTSFDLIKTKLAKSDISLYVMKLENQKEMEGYLSQGGGFNTKQFQKYFKRFPCKDCVEINDGKTTLANCEDCLEGMNKLPVEKLKEINKALYFIAQEEITTLISQAGGRLFSITNLEDLTSQYDLLLEELHMVYSIGYYPEQTNLEAKWHNLEVKTMLPNVTLCYKKGYWAKNH
ncbi:MAG: VWA domain-containing protein [Acidobacteria bacterium]|nr:VWA domain-containing protein [Acidobacteriota bacterium]